MMRDHLKKIQSTVLPLWQKVRHFVSFAQEKFVSEKCYIGIDVGYHSVKAAQMANIDGARVMTKSTLVEIKGLPGKREEVIASLKMALVGYDLNDAKVSAVINCPETCTRKITAPKMPQKELAEAVRWEAKNAIPFSIEDALIDFEILDEIAENGTKKLLVAVAATPRETADKFIALFKEAGVDLAALVPVSISLQNLISLSGGYGDKNVAVVEIGASVSELNIFQKGRLSFSRKLPIAGGDITKAMTSTLMSADGKIELTTEEAEAIKKEYGIPVGSEDKKVNGKIMISQIVSLVRPCVEQLAGEIERSFDFFREESRGEKIDEIILFGGGAQLKNLRGYLHNQLGVPVAAGNAFEGIRDISVKEGQEREDAVRFDLAVGALVQKKSKINLLPIELKGKTKRFIEQVSLEAVAVGIAMTLLLTFIGLKIQLGAQHKKLNALRLEQTSLVSKTDILSNLLIVNRIQGRHPHWEDVLKEISNTMLPKMYLTNLNMDGDVVYFQGVITQADEEPQSILSNFMIALENGIFRDVSLVSSKKEVEGELIFEFEIAAEVE